MPEQVALLFLRLAAVHRIVIVRNHFVQFSTLLMIATPLVAATLAATHVVGQPAEGPNKNVPQNTLTIGPATIDRESPDGLNQNLPRTGRIGSPARNQPPMGMDMGMGMMGGVGMVASPVDPLVQQDLELESQVQRAVQEFASAKDEEGRESARQVLGDTLYKQFALRQQRREQEISEIEERVTRLREALKKRGDAKREIIARRMGQLLTEAEGLGWGEVGDGRASAPGATVPQMRTGPQTFERLPIQPNGTPGMPGRGAPGGRSRPNMKTLPDALEHPKLKALNQEERIE